jgi:hypothetical protein
VHAILTSVSVSSNVFVSSDPKARAQTQAERVENGTKRQATASSPLGFPVINRKECHRRERQKITRAKRLNLRHHSFFPLELRVGERLQAPAGIWATRKVQRVKFRIATIRAALRVKPKSLHETLAAREILRADAG